MIVGQFFYHILKKSESEDWAEARYGLHYAPPLHGWKVEDRGRRVGGNGGVLQKFSHDLAWMKKFFHSARS
jgi:hypothetical protein